MDQNTNRFVQLHLWGFLPLNFSMGGPLDEVHERREADQWSNDSVVSHVLSMKEKMSQKTQFVRDNLTKAQRLQKRGTTGQPGRGSSTEETWY